MGNIPGIGPYVRAFTKNREEERLSKGEGQNSTGEQGGPRY